jgi:hypothetical protein
MVIDSQAADPVIHQAAIAMARKFVRIVSALLRDEEKGDALREGYRVE